MSDDFNRANLDPGRWTFVNPLDDGWVAMTGTGSADAFLELSVPEGPSHDPWQALNRSVRVMQAATDGDFEIDVHFTSEPDPNEAFQLQGVIVEESLGKWLRFDVYSDGDGLNIFAASTQNGSSSSRINTSIVPGDGAYLRINRTGDTWTLSYSSDGATWTEAGSFDYALQVTAVGPFAANHNSGSNPAPAFTAQVDYFFNTASPITSEDGTPEADTWAPFIHTVQAAAGANQLVVTWYTDEPAVGRLNYGPTGALGTTISEPGLSYFHSLTIPNLNPGQSVFYQIESEDGLGQIATSSVEEVNFDPAGPTIDIWYGDEQDFGQLGNPQEFWINILGNVSDPDGVVDLSYTLDGGSPIALSIGPDGRRLENSGDFNVDLNWTTLSDGPHTVVISAEDGAGNVTTKTVTVNYTSGNIWPTTYTADWSSLTTDGDPTTPDPAIQGLSQVVDGNWSVDNGEIRTVEPGYDRLVAILDNLSTDYRVKVPVTVYNTPGGFGAGVLFRWNGHTDTPVSCAQPKCGYLPLGAIGWFRSGKLEFYQGVSESFSFSTGVPYWFLMEVESTTNGPTYRLKVWEVGQTEPTDWNLVQQEGPGTPQKGSLLLIAHQADVSFGTVEVTELTQQPNTPPTAQDDDAFVIPGGTVGVPVLNNDSDPDGLLAPGTVSIDQGPNHGTILDIDAATGVVTYQHDGSGNLSDQFSYTVKDNDGALSNIATVDITVTDNPPLAFQSDDFCDSQLQPFWTFVNTPQADGTLALTGSGTSNAYLELSVPGGSEHQIFTSGIGAAHLLQDAADTDFGVEVKFVSPLVSPQYQMQGVVVKESDDKYLRFEFYSRDPDEIFVYGQGFDRVNGSPGAFVNKAIGTAGNVPQYMRVERSGDQWSFSYSFNGQDWTLAGQTTFDMTVTALGPYAGNATGNSSPAHTAQIDYFENLAAPIVNEDGCSAQALPILAAIGNQTVEEGQVLVVNLSADDPDGDNALLTFTESGLPGFAQLVDNNDGTATLTLSPQANDANTYPVTITVTDGDGLTDDETFDIVVEAPGGVSTLVSDDFCDGLGEQWTFVSAANGGSQQVSGIGTGDAWLELSVPAGPENQVWVNGIQAAHVLQSANDVDFQVEVKMESPVTAPQYQMQGVVVKQDDYNFLRFEIYSTNTATSALAAVLSSATNTYPLTSDIPINGAIGALNTAPVYMRVTRTGDQWTQSYSFDGANWTQAGSFTHAMTVNSVGLYGGNGVGASSPAHTAQFDYFQSSADPLAAEDDCSAACPITALSAGAQTACDPATNTYTQEVIVTYGEAPGTGTLDVNGQSFAIESSPQTVTLTGLPADGVPVDVTAVFSDNPDCPLSAAALFTAPADCATSEPSTLISDDFCDGPGEQWTFVNPQSDGSQQVTGAGTGDAWLELSAPAGASHELWTSGIQAPHVIQSANDVDFQVEVKMESPVTAPQYQEQGILVKQDDYNFLRFEIYSSNSATNILGAILSSATNAYPLTSAVPISGAIGALNTAPVYMRVTRTGDQWTQSYSFDGANWTQAGSFTHAMVVNGVGLYSGNAGSNPAHTAQFDYFESTDDPLPAEDDCGPGEPECLITALSAGAQTACDPATNTYAQEVIVTYGAAPGTGTLDVNGQSFAIESSPQPVTLTGLPADGQPVDVTASFSDATDCTASETALFTAPADCTPPSGPAVVSFILVNATTDQDILTLTDGAILDASTLPTQLNIRAVTNPPVVGSVQLQLSGPEAESRTENVAPYALFGDSGGNYNGQSLPLGVYTLTATPFSGSGGSGTPGASLTISFELAPEPAVFYTVTLSDDGNGSASGGGTFPAGSTVTVSATPDAGYQFANWTNPGGGVVSTANPYAFALSGDVSLQANFGELPCGGAGFNTYYLDSDEDGYGDPDNPTEACSAPAGYVANAGDCDDADATINPDAEDVCDGVDNDCDGLIDEDAGALETYYADADNDGFGDPDSPVQACTQPDGYVANAGDCNDEDASVNPDATEICDGVDNNCDGLTDDEDPTLQCGDAVVRFVLIDAATNQPVAGYDPLADGAVLDAGTLPAQLNIQAVTNPAVVGSVELQLSGPENESRTENVAPYALFGDSGGNYNGESLTAGAYTLTATPYSNSGAGGEAGSALTISFTIVEGSGLLTAPAEEGLQPSLVPEDLSLQLFPNPARTHLNVRFSLPKATEEVIVRVSDLSGKLLLQREFEGVEGRQEVGLEVDRLTSGIYLLQLITSEGHSIRQFGIAR